MMKQAHALAISSNCTVPRRKSIWEGWKRASS